MRWVAKPKWKDYANMVQWQDNQGNRERLSIESTQSAMYWYIIGMYWIESNYLPYLLSIDGYFTSLLAIFVSEEEKWGKNALPVSWVWRRLERSDVSVEKTELMKYTADESPWNYGGNNYVADVNEIYQTGTWFIERNITHRSDNDNRNNILCISHIELQPSTKTYSVARGDYWIRAELRLHNFYSGRPMLCWAWDLWNWKKTTQPISIDYDIPIVGAWNASDWRFWYWRFFLIGADNTTEVNYTAEVIMNSYQYKI